MATTKKPANPVTPSAREAFVLYLGHWQEKLGLSDWRVHVNPKPASKANAADVRMHYEARLASVCIGRDFGSEVVDDKSIEAYAVHELGHVLLTELLELAKDPNTAADVLTSAEHRVINAYTYALLGRN